MRAEVLDNRKIGKINACLQGDKSQLLLYDNASASAVYDKVIFDFQSEFFQHVFQSHPVDESVTLIVFNLSHGVIQSDEHPSSLTQILLQCFNVLGRITVFWTDHAEHFILIQHGILSQADRVGDSYGVQFMDNLREKRRGDFLMPLDKPHLGLDRVASVF